jgi:hypothetical protein
LPCVTVSEYKSDVKGVKSVIRVFRFTYPGNLEKEAAKWRKTFVKADGWKVASKPGEQLIMTRDLKTKGLKYQALILGLGRWYVDPRVTSRTRRDTDPGYISVSMNVVR